MAHEIFISYSSKDKPIADGVCANLEAAGIRCWVAPRDIAPGEDWPTAIAKAISQSRVMVLVFSSSSNSSDEVSRELILAANSKLVIIPFKIENVEPEPGKQYYLARTHWLDAINPLTQEQISTLIDCVKTLIPARESPPVAGMQSSIPPRFEQPQPKQSLPQKTAWIRYLWIPGILGVVVLSMIWNQYAFRSVQTASPTETPQATATATQPVGVLFADDFNDIAYNDKFDTDRWVFPSYYRFITKIGQENGALVFKRLATDGGEDGQLQTTKSWAFGEFNYIEARLKIDGQYTGTSGNLNLGIVQAPVGSDTWYSTCGINMGNPQPQLWCIQVSKGNSFDYNQFFQYLEYNKSYTVRIQIDPQTAELSYYLDGQLLDHWQPTNIGVLKNSRFIIVMGASASQGTGMTAYIDDVKIEK